MEATELEHVQGVFASVVSTQEVLGGFTSHLESLHRQPSETIGLISPSFPLGRLY